MSQVRVVVMVCDACGAEGDTESVKNYTVKNNNSPGKPRTFDACSKCAGPVVKLLDKVRSAGAKVPA